MPLCRKPKSFQKARAIDDQGEAEYHEVVEEGEVEEEASNALKQVEPKQAQKVERHAYGK